MRDWRAWMDHGCEPLVAAIIGLRSWIHHGALAAIHATLVTKPGKKRERLHRVAPTPTGHLMFAHGEHSGCHSLSHTP